ncbi:MAG: LarC family nickel insertion protein [Actinomycetota bacterium]
MTTPAPATMSAAGRLLHLDPAFGASGDMLLGALLGLGAPLDRVRADVAAVLPDGWSIEVEPVLRGGIDATRAVVTTADDHPHRAWSTIDALIAAAEVAGPVADGARRTFRRLGEVEAAIHRIALDEVHFHEVGALDAIVDIVAVWSARYHLGIDAVTAGSVGLGHGRVDTAHGLLPTPAPATADLLAGAPVHPIDVAMETVTPTGAALLTTLGPWGRPPPGRLDATARGAGGRNPDGHPNVVTATLLSAFDPTAGAEPGPTIGDGTGTQPGPTAGDGTGTQPDSTVDAEPGRGPGVETVDGATTTMAAVLATNLDDATPELIAHTIDRLLTAGADDAWVVPVVMKKGRPGHELRILAAPDRVEELRGVVFAETGTLGIRTESIAKTALPRTFRHVEIRGHRIAIKVGPHHSKPEFDDLRAAAEATGLPLRQLAREALVADSSGLHVTFDR